MTDLQLSLGDLKYRWIDGWAQIPDSIGWAHHDIVVTRDGRIITGHPTSTDILFFDKDGVLLNSWSAPVVETHGFCLSVEDGEEIFWLADVGRKRDPAQNYEYPQNYDGKVLKFNIDGKVLAEIDKSAIPGYEGDTYFSPTQVTVHQESGDIWITDGYGQNKTHSLSKEFNHLITVDGSDGAGNFNCPHGVFIDTRKADPEVYIADRGNHRIQIYDLEGTFKRCIGEDILTSPSVFDLDGDNMVVGELNGRIAIFDGDDGLVGFLGDGSEYFEKPGWPNRTGVDGNPVRPDDLMMGKFNSPHGMAVDDKGNVYVSEWFIGGRYTKLERI